MESVRYNGSGLCFTMNEATSELLADANDIVREQLALAWRKHIEHVREVLEAQWPERMERAIEETVAGLAARLETEYQDALEARLREAAQSGKTERRDLIQKLNQTARRLRHFENEGQWSHTLVDATRGFCGRAALFLVHDRKLHFEASRNIDQPSPADDISLDSAPAFATAVETRDTLVAMRSSSELSENLAAFLAQGQDQEVRCCLFPIVTRQGVPAVLYADSDRSGRGCSRASGGHRRRGDRDSSGSGPICTAGASGSARGNIGNHQRGHP